MNDPGSEMGVSLRDFFGWLLGFVVRCRGWLRIVFSCGASVPI
jgi:hypothetical protein